MIRIDRATLTGACGVVLEGASLDVPAGRAVALIGRAGAGKSSLLAAIAGAHPLAGGDIVVHDRSVRREAAAVRRLVGYVPAQPSAWPTCRVGEFLDLAGAAAGLGGKPLRTSVSRALETAGLRDRAADPIDTLPHGCGRMLLVARALLHDPQVLVLDDPFSGLDPVQRQTVERIVGDAHLVGRIVVAAVDDASVPECFTHLAMLETGRLTTSGPADAAALAPGLRYTYRITSPARADEAAAVVRPLAADATAVDLDHVEATIDPGMVPPSRLVAAVVAAGLPVEAAGFHPDWPAQLLRRTTRN